uniref:Uncharacterized protein n=1 Tax=Oryza sativa subsp. japonica TaxID=39947 RepID=Q8H4R0_ORYSJ|nr:hypothetical protein [Oryza sativa Japonica Group]
MEASYTSGGGRSVSIISKEYIRVQVTHGIDEIGGIEPPRSIPSIGNFAAHDDVVGELAIFRGTSTSWVVVAVEIAVGELGFADNGEWGTEMVKPDRDGWLACIVSARGTSVHTEIRTRTNGMDGDSDVHNGMVPIWKKLRWHLAGFANYNGIFPNSRSCNGMIPINPFKIKRRVEG